jgi:hypothetical protein
MLRILKVYPVCNDWDCNDECIRIDCQVASGACLSDLCDCDEDEDDITSKCECCKICKYIQTERYYYLGDRWLKQPQFDRWNWPEKCEYCNTSVGFVYVKNDIPLFDKSLKNLHVTVKHEEEEIECLLSMQNMFQSK